MTSIRQIEANRRNATQSTGPNTEVGKNRSRRHAVRDGLCAETVVETAEDICDYRGFEAAVIADYDARTAVERDSCFAWPHCYGVSVAPLPTRRIYLECRLKFCVNPA